MSSYYDDDDELDIHIHRGGPVVYPEHRRPARPVYYHHGSSYLEPQSPVGRQRSRSTGGRSPPPGPPVIINKIYNEDPRYDDEEDRPYLQIAPRPRARSRSRSRVSYESSRHSSHTSRDEYELEKTRRELDAFRIKAEREEEEKRLKKEMELEKLRKEKRDEEEQRRIERENKEAIEKYKMKEAERAAAKKKDEEEAIARWKAKEEKERRANEERAAAKKKDEEEAIARWKAKEEKERKANEEREKEYQHRLEDDLRKAGYDERQIAVVTKKEKAIDPNRPTFTRMARRHLSIETLNVYKIDYEFDADPNYVLIRRWVPEYEQDFLWNHTREIRERRQPVLVAIEGKKKHGDVEFEFVRKKEHKRKVSPSPLLTYLAGGKR